jgi:hypothetical protein
MVPLVIEARVGVAEAGMAVGGAAVWVAIMGVAVGETDSNVGGAEVGVDKISTEKVQASSNSALNTRQINNGNHFCRCMEFSLSTFARRIKCDQADYPRKNRSLEFPTGNEYKTFVRNFLFPVRGRLDLLLPIIIGRKSSLSLALDGCPAKISFSTNKILGTFGWVRIKLSAHLFNVELL